MRRFLLFLVFVLAAGSIAARASLLFSLDAPTFSGLPGDSIDITGTLLSPDPDPIFINNFSGLLTSLDLDFDLTDFFTVVPNVFNSGDSYSGPIVSVIIGSQAQPGNYFGSITLQGGADSNASDDLATQNFQFTLFIWSARTRIRAAALERSHPLGIWRGQKNVNEDNS